MPGIRAARQGHCANPALALDASRASPGRKRGGTCGRTDHVPPRKSRWPPLGVAAVKRWTSRRHPFLYAGIAYPRFRALRGLHGVARCAVVPPPTRSPPTVMVTGPDVEVGGAVVSGPVTTTPGCPGERRRRLTAYPSSHMRFAMSDVTKLLSKMRFDNAARWVNLIAAPRA